MSECRNDLRPGGEYRYTGPSPAATVSITGVNKEVTPPSRGQHRVVGDPWPVSTNIMELTEVGGQTTLVMTIGIPRRKHATRRWYGYEGWDDGRV
jgi:uncharacterized protein YndB with AHSA1/START domain